MVVTVIIVAIIVLVALWVISTYNKLVRVRTMAEEGFSTMDVYLKKRFDLIPNVVSTVKGYAKHEAETFERVVAARNTAYTKGDNGEIMKAEGELSTALKSLFALAESYPELKANENFIKLQGTLETIETDIAQARKYYNGCVKTYNMALMVFPTCLIAGLFGFHKMSFFEAASTERENVKVEF